MDQGGMWEGGGKGVKVVDVCDSRGRFPACSRSLSRLDIVKSPNRSPLTPTSHIQQPCNMPNGPRGKTAKKQYRAPCLCGCGSRCPATIAAHGKALMKKRKLDALAHARSCLTGLSRQNPGPSSQNIEDYTIEYPPVEGTTAEHMMVVDPPPDDPSPPLTHVWTNRAGRHEREDEDLVPEPDLPGSSEDEDEPENGEDPEEDEPNLISDDDEPPMIHAEIPATEQLTAEFQARAAKASMFPPAFSASHHPNSIHFQHRSIWTHMTWTS